MGGRAAAPAPQFSSRGRKITRRNIPAGTRSGLWLRRLAEKRNFLQGFNPTPLSGSAGAVPEKPEENWRRRPIRPRRGTGHRGGRCWGGGWGREKPRGAAVETPEVKKSRGKRLVAAQKGGSPLPPAPQNAAGLGGDRGKAAAARPRWQRRGGSDGAVAAAAAAAARRRGQFSSF